jgi:hypothetical protein
MSDLWSSIFFAISVSMVAAALMAYWETSSNLNRWRVLQLKECREGLTAEEQEELDELSRG